MIKGRFLNLLLILSILLSQHVLAQPELGECTQNVKDLALSQIPKAQKAWRRGDYKEVQRYLEKAVDFDPKFADGNYLLGELYLKKGQLSGTEACWEKVIKACPDYKADLYFFLGVLLVESGKEKRGIELLETYVKHPDRDPALVLEAKEVLDEKQIILKLKAAAVPFNPKPVPGISTPEDEYLGCVSPDMELFFFTRKLKRRNKYAGPAGGTRLVEEFTLSNKSNNRYTAGDPIRSPFNDKYNEGGPSITADNTELFFTICEPNDTGYLNCDLWYTRQFNGDWDPLKPLPEPINRANSWESQPSISANGDLLFFASNRKEGVGGIDIYMCHRMSDRSWGPPINLGKQVNTRGNEKTPFLHSDSRTLYFSSDGLPGVGGYDIFYTRLIEDKWQKPENIGYPINNEQDNVGLFVSLDGKTAYFSTKQFSSRKDFDIYYFELPEKVRPDRVTLLRGSLQDESGKAVTDAKLELKNLKTQEKIDIKVDELNGSYTAAVRSSHGENHMLTVKKKEIAFSARLIDEKSNAGLIQGELEASALRAGREFKLNDIHFESNSSELNFGARNVLDAFALFLNENPKVRVEIQGHTDEVGSVEANRVLSSDRAKVVYKYLVDEGIYSSRLSHKGYGSAKPIANNSTEKGKARNRRTVFVINSN